MKELPGGVYVSGQISFAQLEAIAARGVKSIIVNRPDMEVPAELQYKVMETAAKAAGLKCLYVPMASGLTMELLEASEAAYRDLERPILAVCASGTRSAALWGFAHVQALGIDGVMSAMQAAGYNLEQIRSPLEDYLNSKS